MARFQLERLPRGFCALSCSWMLCRACSPPASLPGTQSQCPHVPRQKPCSSTELERAAKAARIVRDSGAMSVQRGLHTQFSTSWASLGISPARALGPGPPDRPVCAIETDASQPAPPSNAVGVACVRVSYTVRDG